MTIPYGAGKPGQAERVLKEAMGRLPMEGLSSEQAQDVAAIAKWVEDEDEEARKRRRRLVRSVVKRMFRSEWKNAGKGEGAERAQAQPT
jgi:hypothetical protein